MSEVKFDVIEHERYLEFISTGDPTENQWIELLNRIVEELDRSGKSRVFVDTSGLSVLPDPMVRYRMGIRVGETFSVNVRIAILFTKDMGDRFWETVANNRGAMAHSGDDREELLAWLLEENDPPQ